MLQVTLTNAQQTLEINASLHEKLLAVPQKILADAGVLHAQLEIAVVDDDEIQRVHRDFLGKDSTTDVISFPYLNNPEEKRIEGELFLSADTALRSAPEFNLTPKQELLLYAIHGTLHLVGYDDQTDLQRTEMRAKEQEYLQPVLGENF